MATISSYVEFITATSKGKTDCLLICRAPIVVDAKGEAHKSQERY